MMRISASCRKQGALSCQALVRRRAPAMLPCRPDAAAGDPSMLRGNASTLCQVARSARRACTKEPLQQGVRRRQPFRASGACGLPAACSGTHHMLCTLVRSTVACQAQGWQRTSIVCEERYECAFRRQQVVVGLRALIPCAVAPRSLRVLPVTPTATQVLPVCLKVSLASRPWWERVIRLSGQQPGAMPSGNLDPLSNAHEKHASHPMLSCHWSGHQ